MLIGRGRVLRSTRGRLTLLDLSLARFSGQRVPGGLEDSNRFEPVPVALLGIARRSNELEEIDELDATCYMEKPLDLNQIHELVCTIEELWLTTVKLPVERRAD